MRTAPSPGGHGGPSGFAATIWHVSGTASRKMPLTCVNTPGWTRTSPITEPPRCSSDVTPPTCVHGAHTSYHATNYATPTLHGAVSGCIPMEVDRACNADKRPFSVLGCTQIQ